MTTPDELVSALLAMLRPKHAGGRPKGMRNAGPDKLDKAIMALNRRRARMTPEEIAASEQRVNRFLTQKLPIMRYKMRCLLVAAGVPKEELDVVVAYKRSEDRVGMSRTKRFKAAPATIGAGYEEPVYDDELTEKELDGRVERAKPRRHKPKRSMGYETAPEPIVEASLDDEKPVTLWGQDVSKAIQEELGYEPVRARRSGRRWLAPANLTEEFTIGPRTVTGAGDGKNGRVLPEFVGGKLSYAAEPTIGECRQMELQRSDEPRESELYRELDLVRRCPPLRPIRQWQSFSLAGGLKAPQKPIACLPRSEGEHRAGPYATHWRENPQEKIRAIVMRALEGKLKMEGVHKAIK